MLPEVSPQLVFAPFISAVAASLQCWRGGCIFFNLFWSWHISVSVWECVSQLCLHSLLVSCQQLSSNPPNSSFVSLQLTKVFECFHVSLSVFRSRKCQTRIKELGKTYKNLWGLKLKTFGVLLGKHRVPWSPIWKGDPRQHGADERANHLKDEALRSSESSSESSPHHALTPPPTATLLIVNTGDVAQTHQQNQSSKSSCHLPRHLSRKKDVVANAEWPAFPSDDHTEGAENIRSTSLWSHRGHFLIPHTFGYPLQTSSPARRNHFWITSWDLLVRN